MEAAIYFSKNGNENAVFKITSFLTVARLFSFIVYASVATIEINKNIS